MITKSLVLAVSRDLSHRVEQLCGRLTELRDRMRTSVAEVLGQTIGSAIRDGILCVLGNVRPAMPGPPPPSWSSRSGWQERDQFDDDDLRQDHDWPDDREYDENLDEQDDLAPMPKPSRFSAALSVGLQTLAWCYRQGKHMATVLTLATVAVLATYAMPTLAVVSLGVLGI